MKLGRLGGRTRFVRVATRIAHPRLMELEQRRRRNPVVRALAAPTRTWLRRGALHVSDGPGAGLRVSLAHLPLAHAHAGSIARGWLEIEVQEALRRHVGPGAVVYDIGANIGFFSLLAARLAGPKGRVYAFEPVGANAAAVRANAALNALHNIEVIQLAAGAAGGRQPLLEVEDLSWSHLASRGMHPKTERVVEVEVAALDDLVAAGRIPPPTFVKIDVEGSEVDVLSGLRLTLTRERPLVVCELHGTNTAFVDAVDELGYEVQNLEGPQPVREAAPNVHALAIPRRTP